MKIGIVNDEPLATEALRRALAKRPEHRVAWVASGGAEGVDACRRERPDLVLMDLLMPRMNGAEATRRIMAATPCPILIVAGDVDAHAALALEAIGFGALEAVDAPHDSPADPLSAAPLLRRIDMLGKLIDSKSDPWCAGTTLKPATSGKGGALVVLGASAGGPLAVAQLLAGLPKAFPAAIIIVQHIGEAFAAGMASWLGQHARLPVRLAREGDRPEPGGVLLAATNDHLIFRTADRLGYRAEPVATVYRPSIDVFFESANRLWEGQVVGVLLTGMGSDGALGLKALRDRGRHTIAQDQESSAVYGMPKAAAALRAASDIVPLEHIAPKLLRLFAVAVPEGKVI